MAHSQTFDIQFTPDGFRFQNPADRAWCKKWGASYAPKPGYFEIGVGAPVRAYWLLKAHFGPIIDGFVRLSGNTNKEYWHHYLKALFLTDVDKFSGQPYTRSLKFISNDEAWQFNERSKDHLKDQGGYLDEDEWRVCEKGKKREAVPA